MRYQRLLEHRGEAEAPPAPPRPRQSALRVRAAAAHTPRTGQHSIIQRSLPSLQFLGWEKRAQGGQPAPAQHCESLQRNPSSSSTPWGLQSNLWGSVSGNLCWRHREGLPITSAQISADGFLPAKPKQWFQPVTLLACRGKSAVRSDQRTPQGTGWPRLEAVPPLLK